MPRPHLSLGQRSNFQFYQMDTPHIYDPSRKKSLIDFKINFALNFEKGRAMLTVMLETRTINIEAHIPHYSNTTHQ